MAKPSDTFTWATDATFLSGPRIGETTTVTPQPGELAQGFVPGATYPSEWSNYILNLTGEWISWVDTYAPGLELTNTFTGVNSFNALAFFHGEVTINDNLNATSTSVFGDTATFQATLNAQSTVQIAAEMNLNPASFIDSPMSFDSACFVEGAWKVTQAAAPIFTCDAGTAGATSYATNHQFSFLNAETRTVAEITLPGLQAFSIVVTMLSWVDNSAQQPTSTQIHISGYSTAGALIYTSAAINTNSGAGNYTHSVGDAGLDLRLYTTNVSGGTLLTNSTTMYTIQVADMAQ